jgi:glycosyltransferase involved in cell wall biosynthesis
MRKIRVLRIISRMNLGGPAIQVMGLSQKLSDEQFDQLLLTGYCTEGEIDYLDIQGAHINYHRIFGFGRAINLLTDLRSLMVIISYIRTFSPEIIHTHTAKAGALGRIASILSGKTHIRVHTFHGHLLHGYFGRIKTKSIVLVERFLGNRTHSLIAVGEQVKQELLQAKIGQLEKYNVFGPGLDLGRVPDRNESLRELGVPSGSYNIVWIGRATPVKAPQRILDIATECASRDLDVQFILAGDGPLLPELKQRADRMNLPLHFLGWQTYIERVLSISDLVILTSENEGMPVALIQAQMAGIPVLTTDVGSASEVLIDGLSGFCLKYSAEQFADRIEVLLNDIHMQKSFSKVARQNSLDKFSLSRLVSDHSNLYRRLTSQSNS